ncbi:MAG: mechanosensitive ion channel family protein [Gemmatimonadales bacterium]
MFDWLQQFGLAPELQRRLLSTAVILAGLWLARRVALALAYRRVRDPWARYRWRKVTTYVSVALGTLLIGRLWVSGLGALATFLGLLSAGLAIALKDLVANIAGWAYIVWRQPFEVGDRIQIGQSAGDVIDIGVFQFTLNEIGGWVQADQSTGRIIHVPNGRAFSEPIANYHQGFPYLWHEIAVSITFESNWRKAKEVLTRIAARHAEALTPEAERHLLEASRKYLIAYAKLTPIVYTRVVEDGVQLTMRYLVEPRRRRGTEQAIWEDILAEFERAPDIQFAYVTRRGFSNLGEGKPALRGGPPSAAPGSSLPPPA